jgi:phenylalanyl-tRNA synthetase beta subunit
LLADIIEIMNPYSQAESHLRTTLLYTNMTAKAVSSSSENPHLVPKEFPR